MPKEDFDKFESDMRKQMKYKIGHDDFMAVTSKYASTAELNNMRFKIMDSINNGKIIQIHTYIHICVYLFTKCQHVAFIYIQT